jgi:hypothetical protein
MFMFAWPSELMIASMVSLLLAIIVPWCVPSTFRLIVGAVLAVLSVAIWFNYEVRLKEIAPPGDPLIRVDWLVIAPLLIIVLFNLFLLICVSVFRLFRGRQ